MVQRLRRRLQAACLALVLSPAGALAQGGPAVTIWDIPIGMNAADMPAEDLVDPACGTNGGPPGIPLSSFMNYRICPADDRGLREVTFIYDDEAAYVARARRDLVALQNVDGTRVLDQPVIVSVLFDDDGVVQGIRIVTDPRADPQTRYNAFQLRTHFKARFGDAGWSCEEQPADEGETPVGPLFVKERCRKTLEDGRELLLSANFFHKPGQTPFDPVTQLPTPFFESTARLEILSAAAAARAPRG